MMIDTHKHGGFTIKIGYDECPQSPREDEPFGTLVAFHKRCNLGDKSVKLKSSDFGSWAEVRKHIEKEMDPVVILPVFMLDHSGIALNTTGFSCPWDSGQVGYIFMSRDDVKKWWPSWKKLTKARLATIEKGLVAAVETYSSYVNGEVYYYAVIGDEGVIDSCGGFIGDANEALDEAKRFIDSHVKWLAEQAKLCDAAMRT